MLGPALDQLLHQPLELGPLLGQPAHHRPGEGEPPVRELLTEELTLEIASVLPEGAVTDELRPARGPLAARLVDTPLVRAAPWLALALALLLLMAMSIYASFDFGIYDDLPEVFRSLMNIPDNADAGSLAIGVLYGFYGALTLAGLAISMGSASIAGEERKGTIGLLLGNPKSRSQILMAKIGDLQGLDSQCHDCRWCGPAIQCRIRRWKREI